MCGIINKYSECKSEIYHSWSFAGDPNQFPHEGQKCDCGLVEYNLKKTDTGIKCTI